MIKKITIFLIIIIILFTTNTSNSDTISNLDSYYYILALGLDVAENDLLKVTVQVIQNASSDESSSKEAPKLYSAEGKTLNSCISILNSSLTKQINLSHCSSIVFSQELINKYGISSFISDLGNNTEIRNTAYVMVSSSSSKDFLEAISENSEEFNNRIYDEFINSSFDIGYVSKCTFGNLFNNEKNTNTTSIIPFIINKDGLYQNNGSIILKNGNYISNLSLEENIYLNLLDNKLKSSIISIENPFNKDEFADLEMKPYKKTKFNTYLSNGSPYIEITIYPEFIIKSSGENYDYTDPSNISTIENSLNDLVYTKTSSLIYRLTKELNTDPLQISNMYKKHFLTSDEYNKLNLDKTLKNTFFKINVISRVKTSNLFNKQ